MFGFRTIRAYNAALVKRSTFYCKIIVANSCARLRMSRIKCARARFLYVTRPKFSINSLQHRITIEYSACLFDSCLDHRSTLDDTERAKFTSARMERVVPTIYY